MGRILLIYSILALQFLGASAQRLTNDNNNLLGTWVIDSMMVAPIRIPSYCDSITKGARLVFDSDNKLMVFPKDSTNVCNTYRYRIFEDNEIDIIEHDMIMSVRFHHLGDNTIVLWSESFFDWDEAMISDIETYNFLFVNGLKVYLKKEETDANN